MQVVEKKNNNIYIKKIIIIERKEERKKWIKRKPVVCVRVWMCEREYREKAHYPIGCRWNIRSRGLFAGVDRLVWSVGRLAVGGGSVLCNMFSQTSFEINCFPGPTTKRMPRPIYADNNIRFGIMRARANSGRLCAVMFATSIITIM